MSNTWKFWDVSDNIVNADELIIGGANFQVTGWIFKATVITRVKVEELKGLINSGLLIVRPNSPSQEVTFDTRTVSDFFPSGIQEIRTNNV